MLYEEPTLTCVVHAQFFQTELVVKKSLGLSLILVRVRRISLTADRKLPKSYSHLTSKAHIEELVINQ